LFKVGSDRPKTPLSVEERHKGAAVIKQAPVPDGKTVKVRFVLPQDALPGKVSVVGDFNGWDPFAHPLRPRRNGTRSAAVTLPRGRRFAFRYLAEEGRWHDEETAEAFEPNGVGGYNAVIHT
jgi:1,4-alpha-glucan branching enzyme